jgi:3-hexulose-6-phosphate synthase
MVKLQLAMDTLDAGEALRLAECAAPFVDILEAGTPLIKSVGIDIVRKLKSIHPEKLVHGRRRYRHHTGYHHLRDHR